MEWLETTHEPSIKRTILRDEVKEYILKAILSGALKPEDRIVETQVARHLGVSQAPVREALRELEQIGVLLSKPYRGTFVKKLSIEELKERYIVRASLEETAARLAVPKLSEDIIQKLEQLIENMIMTAEAGDLRQMISLDVEFHRTFIRASGNEFLLSVWENINPGSWTMVTTHYAKRDLVELAKRHHDVLNALISGDPMHASYVIRAHIEELAPNC
ncbi:GntR family transcriptional regulator [Bacillus canaveralius]|uniref:GntR family transcriptional regulator n=1 Tax=Bacillus canaveralius TaxID=1403243 RepID=A0A2N5GMB6_9BACI|nr:GntR family transcriptional regulator [Bacillus canaveralius]PLR82998.1 GntR family transcriptional regulator [Bacillus canaveralius]PLR96998.1 GntR family transcriptional regulator [Bacillus canaveralius]